MSLPTVHLLGDSILDNYYWLSDKNRDLKVEISSLGYIVHNYAVDDTKVYDVINGVTPQQLYITSRPYPYQTEKDNKMYPLKLLAQNVGINRAFSSTYGRIHPIGVGMPSDHIVVISMGGIDLGIKILNIILGTNYYISSVLTDEFIANYTRVIETIRTSCEKIILVSTYLPYLGKGSTYGSYSGYAKPVMEKWHDFLYQIANKHNIPVLDLSRTLNPDDRSHYGSLETRTSNKSSKCIAECIAYINKNYNGHHIYHAPNADASKIVIE
jgi:hypothetical protein